jgi:hypothetical protein
MDRGMDRGSDAHGLADALRQTRRRRRTLSLAATWRVRQSVSGAPRHSLERSLEAHRIRAGGGVSYSPQARASTAVR